MWRHQCASSFFHPETDCERLSGDETRPVEPHRSPQQRSETCCLATSEERLWFDVWLRSVAWGPHVSWLLEANVIYWTIYSQWIDQHSFFLTELVCFSRLFTPDGVGLVKRFVLLQGQKAVMKLCVFYLFMVQLSPAFSILFVCVPA